MLVLHRAKLLASNQSVLALGVAPSGVRAAAPHSAPAWMPGVYALGLCKDAKPTKHTQPFWGKGVWGQGLRTSIFLKNILFLQTETLTERYPRQSL